MIRITKPRRAPKVLKTRGTEKRDAYCREYAEHREDYDRGERTFEFNRHIYAHEDVKKALIRAHHDKCCYCESKITHISYSDIEHFRPKKGFQQRRSDELGRPGYYWLAYDWSNLFLSCEVCNRRHKASLFPLANPDERALCHTDDVAKEQALFVNPSEEEPEEHISFQREVAVPVNRSRKGRTTINALRLNRPKLQAVRRDQYQNLKIIYALAQKDPPEPETQEARKLIDDCLSDCAQYASMVRCAVEDGFGTSREDTQCSAKS